MQSVLGLHVLTHSSVGSLARVTTCRSDLDQVLPLELVVVGVASTVPFLSEGGSCTPKMNGVLRMAPVRCRKVLDKA